jgi:hypothetical protein
MREFRIYLMLKGGFQVERENISVTARNTYSAEELARFCLPGYPRTRKNWYEVVKREGWEVVETPGKGRGGLRREYRPPAEVQALIEAVQRGEQAPASPRSATAKPPDQPPIKHPVPAINIDALVQAVLVAQNAAPKGETPAQSIRRGIEFYMFCMDRGLITPEGQGTGYLNKAA